MAFIVNLALDQELPLMVWAKVSVLYPRDYVLSPKGRMVRATESKVHYLVNRAVTDVRKTVQTSGGAADYLDFRDRVVDRLCAEYGFVSLDSSTRTILHEEVEGLVASLLPRIRPIEQDDSHGEGTLPKETSNDEAT